MLSMLKLVPEPVLGAIKAAALVAVALAVVWLGVQIEQHGADRVQRRWDAVEAARAQADAEQRREDARLANQASTNHEKDRAAMQAARQHARGALDVAMQRPAQCGPTAADLVLPGAMGLQLNAIWDAAGGAPGPAASEPAR